MLQESERRHKGEAAIELSVEYQRLNSFFYDYTRNISKGSTFIRTTKPLEVGTRFVFKLHIPTLQEPLVLGGEVRWVRREEEKPAGAEGVNPPGMGIGFVFEEDQQRRALDALVERMMIASFGQLLYARLREALAC